MALPLPLNVVKMVPSKVVCGLLPIAVVLEFSLNPQLASHRPRLATDLDIMEALSNLTIVEVEECVRQSELQLEKNASHPLGPVHHLAVVGQRLQRLDDPSVNAVPHDAYQVGLAPKVSLYGFSHES